VTAISIFSGSEVQNSEYIVNCYNGYIAIASEGSLRTIFAGKGHATCGLPLRSFCPIHPCYCYTKVLRDFGLCL